MQGIGTIADAVSKHKPSQFMLAAFCAALLMHILLASTSDPLGLLAFDSDQQADLTIQILREPEKQEKEPSPAEKEEEVEELPEENVLENEQTPTQAIKSQTKNTKLLTTKPTEVAEPQVITVPSFNSAEFQQFLRNETENAVSDKNNSLNEFSDTFTAPVKPKIRDTKRETGPLGGGNYKVVKNGIECESLVMVPQTFSEITGTVPLISGIGRCRDLNKKIDLLDKDGKIKNSDRYDWE